MKRVFTFIGLLLTIMLTASATETVSVKYGRKKNNGENSRIERAPMHLPIDVYYDDATRKFEVIGEGEMDAQVYLCDENGATLDYAPCLNTRDLKTGIYVVNYSINQEVADQKKLTLH